ncbi:RmlC-like cupins superfamily protein [Abeliophyllum distichum]|uniref:RmlC-like cupins superfamily protein n=1 Tax=Abeliophyllum distichum TaxID=126358 RepID=A0ABD1PDF2_9LAMI
MHLNTRGSLISLFISSSQCPKFLMQFMFLTNICKNHEKPHVEAVYRLLGYLKGAPGKGLVSPSQGNIVLRGYCDADWAVVPSRENSSLDIAYFLAIHSFHEKLRSNLLFRYLQLKQSIVQWL